jgi:hypothetical protein
VLPANKAPAGADAGGDVKYVFDSYVTLGTETTADTIVMGKQPAGTRVLARTVTFEALGGAITLAVGDTVSAARQNPATAAAAAGSLSMVATAANNGYLATVDADLIVTIAGGTVAAAKTINSLTLLGRA